ncbi:MAG: iron donor protein CyaY [Bryobacterales bacterium]|nr:iron donor protein CyaY [Bryobacterales bacterium]
MLDDKSFPLQCDKTIEALYRSLVDAAEEHDLEADMNNGALTVEFEDPPAKFVVSPNSPVHQIWVSAHSKSFKFEWSDQRSAFVLPDTGEDLKAMMGRAVSQQLGEDVVLP